MNDLPSRKRGPALTLVAVGASLWVGSIAFRLDGNRIGAVIMGAVATTLAVVACVMFLRAGRRP